MKLSFLFPGIMWLSPVVLVLGVLVLLMASANTKSAVTFLNNLTASIFERKN